MSTINGAISNNVSDLWANLASGLKQELGDGPFSSYVAPAYIIEVSDTEVCLVTSTNYAKDWFQRHALRRIHQQWSKSDPLNRIITIRSKAELGVSLGHKGHDESQTAPESLIAPLNSQTTKPTIQTFSPTHEQRVQPIGAQERLRFETFVKGRGNEFAYETACKIAAFEPLPFNPVFFYGPYGQGKTHLLSAIAWTAQKNRPEAHIMLLTAEKFISSFVKAVMEKSMAKFKDELRSTDLLLIDDVHFIGGKNSSQEELFHTLSAVMQAGKRVIFSGDRPPSMITELETRLRSHLSAGLICSLEPADYDLRLDIIERKIESLQSLMGFKTKPSREIYEILAERIPGSIRELEGAVNTLVATSGQKLGDLSPQEALNILLPNLKVTSDRRITVDEIQKTTANYFNLKQADLLCERRTRSLARPRQIAMWLCRKHTPRSFPDIGARFGGRDHTTVLHAVRKVDELMLKDEVIVRDIEALTLRLRNG
jgi:chromosomal replication initiator protein